MKNKPKISISKIRKINIKNYLVINCGSTSTKYKLFSDDGTILEDIDFGITVKEEEKESHFLEKVKLSSEKNNIKIDIAFRVVHGGDIKGPLKINKKVLKKIKEFEVFAPIHNKLVLKKIEQIKYIFNKSDSFAVFDTDFHQTIPEKNRLYAIDKKISKKYKIFKYGFHGIAVESALENYKETLKEKKEKLPSKIIAAHLGGGASLTAIVKGKSIANTMGLTPISGLVMTTRVGETDSDMDIILSKLTKKTPEEISHMLSYQSGLFGLAGSKDIKAIFERAEKQKKEKKGKYKKEELAFDIYFEKLIEKIFAFTGKMGGIDKIIFSGGTGYGNSFLRNEIAKRVKILGISKKDFFVTKIDEEQIIFDKVSKL